MQERYLRGRDATCETRSGAGDFFWDEEESPADGMNRMKMIIRHLSLIFILYDTFNFWVVSLPTTFSSSLALRQVKEEGVHSCMFIFYHEKSRCMKEKRLRKKQLGSLHKDHWQTDT